MRGLHIIAAIAVLAILGLGLSAASAYSIPEGQLDKQKVFWGSYGSFERPGEVDYQEVIKSTPEYQQLKKKKVKRGTGEYWILLSQASDRAVRSIRSVGEDTEYDLVATQGYLGGLEPAIPAEDITNLVIEYMEESGK